ncbi:hypothetical protein K6025_05000 [Ehrlichia sp. JZT12]
MLCKKLWPSGYKVISKASFLWEKSAPEQNHRESITSFDKFATWSEICKGGICGYECIFRQKIDVLPVCLSSKEISDLINIILYSKNTFCEFTNKYELVLNATGNKVLIKEKKEDGTDGTILSEELSEEVLKQCKQMLEVLIDQTNYVRSLSKKDSFHSDMLEQCSYMLEYSAKLLVLSITTMLSGDVDNNVQQSLLVDVTVTSTISNSRTNLVL